MAWNTEALRLIGLPADGTDGPELVTDLETRLTRSLPAAVAEWYRTGAVLLQGEMSDNLICDGPWDEEPDRARYAEAGLLLLETDSQHCCRWVTPLDHGDDPVVYLVDPDDFTGATRTPYALDFTAYTEADVWDGLLLRDERTRWSFDHPLPGEAVTALDVLLDRRPVTFGWAGNQGCEAVHRFDGPARVAVAVGGGMALWTATQATDETLYLRIADILGIVGSTSDGP